MVEFSVDQLYISTPSTGVCIKMKSTAFIFSILIISVSTANAKSTQSGWLDARDYAAFSNRHFYEKMMPVSIKCKSAGGIGQTRRNTLLNAKFAPNPKKLKYHWAWGSQLKVLNRKLKKRGYQMVSYSKFTRPKTGLVVPCAIWHKK